MKNNAVSGGSSTTRRPRLSGWAGWVAVLPSPEPPNRVPRMHNVVPNAKAYIAAFQLGLLRAGGTILCGAPAEQLVADAGRVTGLVASVNGERRTFHARVGVVLAAGDYANAPDIIARYRGPEFTAIEGINPHALGDGHRLAEQVGARLVNMEITYGPELRFVPRARDGFEQLLPSKGPAMRLSGLICRWFLPVVHWMIKRLLWSHGSIRRRSWRTARFWSTGRGQRFATSRIPSARGSRGQPGGEDCLHSHGPAASERYSA